MSTEIENLDKEANSTEESIAQDSTESQVSNPEIETEGSKEAAPTSESDKKDDEPDTSEGITNLRNHVKDLENDLKTVYKPWYEEAEKRGGIELAKEGLGFLDPLMLDDDDESASKFLDHLWNLSDSKYSAIVSKIFADHGKDFLAQQGLSGQSKQQPTVSELEQELDPNDPVKNLIEELRNRVNELENAKVSQVQSQTQEQIEAQAAQRSQEFLDARYQPLKQALDALNLGEDTDLYKQSIAATVERLFVADKPTYDKFQMAHNMAVKGQAKLAAAHLVEVDRKIAEYTQKAIKLITGNATASPKVVEQKIADNKTTLPKTDSLNITGTQPSGEQKSSGKAFDKNDMTNKLRELEAAGRF